MDGDLLSAVGARGVAVSCRMKETRRKDLTMDAKAKVEMKVSLWLAFVVIVGDVAQNRLQFEMFFEFQKSSQTLIGNDLK